MKQNNLMHHFCEQTAFQHDSRNTTQRYSGNTAFFSVWQQVLTPTLRQLHPLYW